MMQKSITAEKYLFLGVWVQPFGWLILYLSLKIPAPLVFQLRTGVCFWRDSLEHSRLCHFAFTAGQSHSTEAGFIWDETKLGCPECAPLLVSSHSAGWKCIFMKVLVWMLSLLHSLLTSAGSSPMPTQAHSCAPYIHHYCLHVHLNQEVRKTKFWYRIYLLNWSEHFNKCVFAKLPI